jgi:O-antigen/teichoic acid export membrane protein
MTADEQPAPSLGARTLRGMLWAFGSYGGGRLLILVATALMARLLTPEDFGLVALALTFTSLLDVLTNLGLGQALILKGDEAIDEHADTAFGWSIVFGGCASLLIAALSPLIAEFFNEPRLVAIVAVLGANFFLRSLGITHYSLAQRSMDFRARTVAELADAIARGTVGIALALAGFGAWSLVIGYLVGSLALDIAIWRLVAWRPRFRLMRTHLRSMLKFGGTLSAADITAAVCSNIDNVFIGRVLGASSLGLYSIAFMVPLLGMINVSSVVHTVLFPAFVIRGLAELRRSFLLTLRYLWLFALPAATLLVILAEPIVLAVFGEGWQGSIDPMRVLAVYGFAMATGFAVGIAYKAAERPAVILWIVAARLVVLVVGLILFIDLGLTAAAACQAVATGGVEAVALYFTCRWLNVDLREFVGQIAPAVGATAIMAIPIGAIGLFVTGPWAATLLGATVGPAVFAGALLLLWPDSIRFVVDRLRGGPAPGPETEPEAILPTHSGTAL